MKTHNASQSDIDLAMGMFDSLEQVEAQLAEWERDRQRELDENTWRYQNESCSRRGD